jgi:hypothetical protein
MQRREHLRLAVEARHALGIVGEGFGQDLDSDVAAEFGVVMAVDLTHATRADRRHDLLRNYSGVSFKSLG